MLRMWKKIALYLLAGMLLFSFPVRAAECPDYCFRSIDEMDITPATNAGKTTLIVYAHLSSNHGNVSELIQTLANAEWNGNPNLSILVVDWMGSTTTELRQFLQPYANENTGITFCTERNENFNAFMEAARLDGSAFSLPISFVVDKNGNLQNYLMGESSELAFQNLLHPYVDGIAPVAMTTLSVTGEAVYSEAFQIVELINVQRQKNNLPAVKMDKGLLDAAMLRAAECAVYYSHTRPNGLRCFTAFPAGGGASGENIAAGQQSAEEVMAAWMKSPGHRANILSENFTSVGVGVFCHEGVYTWVQLFSSNSAAAVKRPADAMTTAKIQVQQSHLVPRADKTLLMLRQDDTKPVSLYFTNRGFDPQSVYPDSTDLTFQTSDPKVAKVDDHGLVTGIAEGTAEITITLAGTNKKATVTVTVTEHNYEVWQYDPPTCSAPGHARYKCEDCGKWLDKELPKLTEHFWDSGMLIRKPTTTKNGAKTYTCTACGEVRTESIPQYSALRPAVTEPPAASATKAPTVPATKAPTAAPAVPATKAPTVAPSVPATKAPTVTPTVPATKTPTAQPTVPAAMPTTAAPTEVTSVLTTPPVTQMPTAPTEPAVIPTDLTENSTIIVTEPTEITPSSAPETVPTQTPTQQPTEPGEAPAGAPDNKLQIGIAVMVIAILLAGGFLIFWKRNK